MGTLPPAEIDPEGVISAGVDLGGTAVSVFSGIAGVIDILAIGEVVSGALGLPSTTFDGSALLEVSEDAMLAPIEADSLLPGFVVLTSSGVDGLDTDPVESGVFPLVLAAPTSEVP